MPGRVSASGRGADLQHHQAGASDNALRRHGGPNCGLWAEAAPPLHVGNLSPTRDYLDVRDAAVALWLLLGSPARAVPFAVGKSSGWRTWCSSWWRAPRSRSRWSRIRPGSGPRHPRCGRARSMAGGRRLEANHPPAP